MSDTQYLSNKPENGKWKKFSYSQANDSGINTASFEIVQIPVNNLRLIKSNSGFPMLSFNAFMFIDANLNSRIVFPLFDNSKEVSLQECELNGKRYNSLTAAIKA